MDVCFLGLRNPTTSTIAFPPQLFSHTLLARFNKSRPNKLFLLFFFPPNLSHQPVPSRGVLVRKIRLKTSSAEKRYICVTLLWGFPISGKPNFEFPFIYKHGNPTSRLGFSTIVVPPQLFSPPYWLVSITHDPTNLFYFFLSQLITWEYLPTFQPVPSWGVLVQKIRLKTSSSGKDTFA